MDSPIIVSEVIGRSEQGATRPFICGGQMAIWYVKGAYAGKNSLCCEWVAARLAQVVLPSAPLGVAWFRMGEVPEALIEGSSRADIRELGEGKVFASLWIDDGQELTWESAQGWSEEIMALLLLLDLWLQNEDRTLTELGGNPNLLVTQIPPLPDDDPEGALWKDEPRREMLWAYDFNLAFDPEFDRERFFASHVFGRTLRAWPEGFRERMEPLLREGLEQVRDIFDELPKEWLHVDGDESLPVQLEVERVISLLELPFNDPDTFWNLP